MPISSLVIVNPNAARVRDVRARHSLLEQIRYVVEQRDGVAPEVIETASATDTGPVVEAGLGSGVGTVIGVGGDGTLRDIAAVLAGSGTPLGVIPAGTGNQLAAVLGIPLATERAAAALSAARPRALDLGEVTLHRPGRPDETSLFTIGCGAGFDARLMATTPSAWKQRFGSAAYFAQAIRLAAKVGVVPYRIRVDDRLIETDATIALVGNMGQLVPGRLGLRLPIEPDDGQLDLLVVGARHAVHGLRGLVDQVWRTAPGGGSGSSSIRLRGRHISIEADRPEPLEVDGDYIGEGSFDARILPAAIEVLVPGL